MKSVVICSHNMNENSVELLDFFFLDRVKVPIALVKEIQPTLRAERKYNDFVLVKKIAFSLNYRDKALQIFFLHKMSKMKSDHQAIFSPIGSEFIGEIIQKGNNVSNLNIGEKVIPCAPYPSHYNKDLLPGIPSNISSKLFQIFHKDQLIKIQGQIPDEVAASITVAGHTAFSMIEKAHIKKDENILITSLKSNTSLALLAALKKYGYNIYGLTTSCQFNERFYEMGITEVINIKELPDDLMKINRIEEIVNKTDGFDVVFDPFADLYLGKVISCMSFNSRYLTCGFFGQNKSKLQNNKEYIGKTVPDIIPELIMKNISIIGNCLGHKRHLEQAIEEYQNGNFNIPIDSVITGNDIAYFFDRTFNDPDRFGKVVYKYDD